MDAQARRGLCRIERHNGKDNKKMACEYYAEKIKKLTGAIRNRTGGNAKCFIGFDGYIDELFSVVQKRVTPDEFIRYDKIEDFGRRILWASGKSADIEICPCKVQIGGNAPILANALASLDYDTVCVGQMDEEEGVNPFCRMHPSCRRISTGKASKTIALEFTDGKIMLGNLQGNHIGWEEIKSRAGAGNLYRMVRESSLVGIVNWGGMYKMNEILRGMLYEALLPLKEENGEEKEIFIDLADPSARSEDDMEELFRLICAISSEFKVTLGMNENEAGKIGGRFCREDSGIEEMGEKIRTELTVYQLVIHTNQRVYGFREGKIEEFSGMHVEKPIQTTGAGDHFNAGFCMGVLENRSLYECLLLGQAMASYYIGRGKTAGREDLAEYISTYYKLTK